MNYSRLSLAIAFLVLFVATPSECVGQREVSGSDSTGRVTDAEADRLANLSAKYSTACWGGRGKTSSGSTCGGTCSGLGKSGGAPCPVGEGAYSRTNSFVDNSKLSFHHYTNDYSPGLSSSSCESCSAGGEISTIPSYLNLQIERRHRYRNLVESGSFGPGVFCNYDIRAVFFPAGFQGGEDGPSGRQVLDRDGNEVAEFFFTDTENGNFSSDAAQVDVFDPREDHTVRLGDEPGGDIRYVDRQNKRVKEGWFRDQNGNAVDGVALASTFEMVAHEGQKYVFEVLHRLGEYEGRLIAIRDRNGYETSLDYEFDAGDQSQDMEALRRLATVSDPHGRTATFQYLATQVGGGWVVSQIDLPNGSSVQYDYDSTGQVNDHFSNGRLQGVTLQDGTQSTFNYEFTTKTTRIEFSDSSAKSTSRNKKVYLSNSNHLRKDSEILNQQAMLARMIRNGAGEVSYLNETRNFATFWVYEGQGKARLNRFLSMVYSRYYEDLGDKGLPTQNKERKYGRSGTGYGTTISSLSLTATNIFSSGQYAWFRDEKDVRIDFEYDGDSFPITKLYSDGTTERFEYNDFKQLTRYEDRLNRVIRWTYDDRGNETSHNVGIASGGPNDIDFHDPNSAGQPLPFTPTSDFGRYRSEYYPSGHANQFLLRYEFDANDNRTEYIYNTDQFLVQVNEPDDTGTGFHTAKTFTYDSAGRLATSTDALGRKSTFTYDNRDRLVQTRFNDNSTERRAYGQNAGDGAIGTANLLVASQDRNGNVTSFEYDAQGRLAKEIQASHKVPLGSVTNPNATDLSSLLTGNQIFDPAVRVESTYSYLNGTNKVASMISRGEKTSYTFDYRHRTIGTKVEPRDGIALESTKQYVDNLLFNERDPYGRYNYFAYRESDALRIRSIQGTRIAASPEFSSFSTVKSKSRGASALTATNSEFLITDYSIDAEGQEVSVIDPRGVTEQTVFDGRGRPTSTTEAFNTPDSATWAVVYDANDNLVEARSPRYFDTNDSDGFERANTVFTYSRRNLPLSRVQAAGAADYQTGSESDVRVVENFSYYNDGRPRSVTDARGNQSFPLWHQCCGRSQGSIDEVGNGFVRNVDFFGNVTHTAVVEAVNPGDLTNGGGSGQSLMTLVAAHDPVDSRVVNETTIRYDARNREIARTVWLEPLGNVDPNNPPIAGGNQSGDPSLLLVAGGEDPRGLTTRTFYDDSLNDGVGLDGGQQVPRLDGNGDLTLNISPLLAELASDGVAIGSESDFSAVVRLNPEDEIAVAVSDGVGRVVATGVFGQDGLLITWSTTGHDSVVAVDGFGNAVETATIDALDHVDRSRSDGAGRVLTIVDAEGNSTESTYDNNSNVASSLDPNGVGEDCIFDLRNRRTACTDSVGDTTSNAYDQNDNVILATDAKGEVASYQFDARDQNYRITNRLSAVTKARYDQNSNLISIVDGEDGATFYTYDPRDLKTETRHPDHVEGSSRGDSDYGIVECEYDAALRKSVITDQLGDTQTFSYDMANRLLSKDYRTAANSPTGSIADSDEFEYDFASRVVQASSDRYDNVCKSTYDVVGRETSETLVAFNRSFEILFEYDVANRRSKLTYPDGSVVDREYTDRNQLKEIKWNGAVVNTRTYDLGARLESSTHGNGVVSTFGYRVDDLIASIDTPLVAGANSEVGAYSYDYDDNKNKVREVITGPMAGFGFGTGSGNATSYDKEDRLTAWNRADGNLDRAWDLSLVGDWDSIIENGITESRTFTAAHEIATRSGISVTHDAKGNLTSEGGRDFIWDFDNQLAVATVAAGADGIEGSHSYTYDAFGRRVTKTVNDGTTEETTLFVFAGPQVVSEYDVPNGQSPSINAPEQNFVYGSYVDEPVLKDGKFADDSQGVVYFNHNQQYSITALTNSSGDVVERYAYTAYGKPTILSPDNSVLSFSAFNNPYGFTARRNDFETDLMYFRARMYDPDLGRFIGRDPLEFIDGLSLYQGYFGTGDMDPSGESIFSKGAIIAAKKAAQRVLRGIVKKSITKKLKGGLSKKAAKQFGKDALDILDKFDRATGFNPYSVWSWCSEAAEFVPVAGDVYGGVKFGKAIADAKKDLAALERKIDKAKDAAKKAENAKKAAAKAKKKAEDAVKKAEDAKTAAAKTSKGTGGGKNAKHSNQKRRDVAKERYDELSRRFDEMKSTPNKTKEFKKEMEKVRKARDQAKKKADFTGENHSQSGGKGPR